MDEQLAPVFVKISDYKDVLDITDLIKKRLKETQETLQRIKDLKEEEDRELAEWNENLNEITGKVDFITKSMFQPNM